MNNSTRPECHDGFLQQLNSNVSPLEEFFVWNMGIWKAISCVSAVMFWAIISVFLYHKFSLAESFRNPWLLYFILVVIFVPAFSLILFLILVSLGKWIKEQAENKRNFFKEGHLEDDEREKKDALIETLQRRIYECEIALKEKDTQLEAFHSSVSAGISQ